MGFINRIWRGEKVKCPLCNEGFFEPMRSDLPLRKNLQFVCSHCGEKLTGILRIPKDAIMETSANFNSSKGILDRLLNGERVKCLECNKGYYLPSNPEAKINHWFTCDNCGDHYHWDPVVDIE